MAQQHETREGGGFILFFLVGFLGALILGWMVFPQVLYSKKPQPVAFNHKAHVENVGMSCKECHTYREDGSYKLANTQECAQCHADVTGGQKPGEKALDQFVNDYVKTGKQVEWRVYQYQPDNVYFSHLAHEGFACVECHPDVSKTEVPPSYYENRITKYSKHTMKMWQCERCHAELGVSNACYLCHM